jgi:hypothetical protein
VTGCARIYTARILISGFVRDIGIDYIRVAVLQGVQHLLGIVNFLHSKLAAIRLKKIGSSGRTRTYNPSVNSRMLCH